MAKAYGITYHILKSRLKYRKDGEELVPLRLSIAYGLGSTVAPELEGRLVSSLEEGGIELEVYAIPAEALLKEYYRLDEVHYDMFFLATNFDTLYDPSLNFTETEDGHHVWKTSALEDDELWEHAVSIGAARLHDPGRRFLAPGDPGSVPGGVYSGRRRAGWKPAG